MPKKKEEMMSLGDAINRCLEMESVSDAMGKYDKQREIRMLRMWLTELQEFRDGKRRMPMAIQWVHWKE